MIDRNHGHSQKALYTPQCEKVHAKKLVIAIETNQPTFNINVEQMNLFILLPPDFFNALISAN